MNSLKPLSKDSLRKLILTLVIISFSVGAFAKLDFALPASVALLIFVVLSSSWDLLHVALVSVLVSGAPLYFPWQLWFIPASNFSIPFLLSTALIWPLRSTRETLSWARVGTIDGVSRGLILLFGVLSAIALILWALWSDNLGIGLSIMKGFSQTPKWLILGIGIPAFAFLNALSEEVVYRGVLQEALHRVWDQSTPLVLILQASAFAAAHLAVGFPNGKLGYLMAFAFAVMLGYLRIRTKGILAPYLAHIVADLAIGYYLCFKVLY